MEKWKTTWKGSFQEEKSSTIGDMGGRIENKMARLE